jgi:uncharacterized protein with HEPN domain
MPALPADDRIRLQHMLEAVQKAVRMVAGRTRHDLDTDDQLTLALQRLIEILGEAAKNVSEGTRAQAGDIPWRQIAGMRDRVIHAYHDVNLDIVWVTVTDDLPVLEASLESLLGTEA